MSEHKIINSETHFCVHCMDVHEINRVEVTENTFFKSHKVVFTAEYDYCDQTDSYSENEVLIKANDLRMKDAYRKLKGLLTSEEIKQIRSKYNVSQKEFSEILGWGSSTIIRYENHQVQDRAHDDILRKIEKDPSWYLEMLERAKENINPKFYMQYLIAAKELLMLSKTSYTFSSQSFKYKVNNIEYTKKDVFLPKGDCSVTYNMSNTIESVKTAAMSCEVHSNIVPAA